MLNVNTRVSVSFNASSRRTFILRTFITPCSLKDLLLTDPFKSGKANNALAGETLALSSRGISSSVIDFLSAFYLYIPREGHLDEVFYASRLTSHAIQDFLNYKRRKT